MKSSLHLTQTVSTFLCSWIKYCRGKHDWGPVDTTSTDISFHSSVIQTLPHNDKDRWFMLLTQMRDSSGEEDLTYSRKALETEAITSSMFLERSTKMDCRGLSVQFFCCILKRRSKTHKVQIHDLEGISQWL